MNRNYYKEITNDMLENGITINTNFLNYIACKNNIVTIKCVVNKSDNFIPNTTANIFTNNYKMPVFLRPSKNIKVPAFFGSGSYALTDIGFGIVQPGGGFYVQNNSSVNLGSVTIDISYSI